NQRGFGPLQDTPVAEMCRPFTKFSFRIDNPTVIPSIVQRAFRLAQQGRPGPTVVEIPFDLCVNKTKVKIPPASQAAEPLGKIPPDPRQIERAIALLASAKRPVILAGGGVVIAGASAELRELSDYLQLYVATSSTGKGSISEDSPLALGDAGTMGWKCSKEALDEADVVLAIGYRFSEFGYIQQYSVDPDWKLIHADADPAEIGKVLPATVGIVGDAKLVLQAIVAEAKAKLKKGQFADTEWSKKLANSRSTWLAELEEKMADDHSPISPYRLVRDIRAVLPENGVFLTDCGNNQCWGIHAFRTRQPKTFLHPGGYGHLGWAFPAAMGVKLAAPDRPVVAFTGDGGFHYSLHELGTAVEQDIPVVIVVLNDGKLNTNRQVQQFMFDNRVVWTEFKNPDFVKLAESFGAGARRVENPADIKAAVAEGLNSGKPFLVDAVIDSSVVFPATGHWTPR
ncbi:MAG: thiamine pyrophosphate-binding protein, partial [Chloroflexi bacterium]|nr:thiamine pyrophosphate-binding protein [Chloroflexota bacterium]